MNLIFPFIGHQAEFDMLDFERRPQWLSLENQEIMQMSFTEFLCPSDPYKGLTTGWGLGGEDSNARNKSRIANYFAVSGPTEDSDLTHPDGTTGNPHHCGATLGLFYNDSRVKFNEVTDGTSHTAALCETWGPRLGAGHPSGDGSSRLSELLPKPRHGVAHVRLFRLDAQQQSQRSVEGEQLPPRRRELSHGGRVGPFRSGRDRL